MTCTEESAGVKREAREPGSFRRGSSEQAGADFVIFIRDKLTGELAGSALFATTPQTGLYCVAAYDRERFSRPVGHIVQAVAMDYMKKEVSDGMRLESGLILEMWTVIKNL